MMYGSRVLVMKDGLMGKAWHGMALMAREDKVRPLTDCSSALA
jgi:hypothetical protein